ncbi:MAG: hypothetical protein K9J16_04695 [Melioribacteraceae bacterium]|nr:hypothetical protein [Melioribacteraceae bacterium]MCF8355426.1 hypothetical protein [Melioribacteraceae bacterium]MCF8393268.1 hypothetical protein [Melioribacteraceae bacterium]MCF8417569.1 hypothetical protein [Melioribacteraceae bacterium]
MSEIQKKISLNGSWLFVKDADEMFSFNEVFTLFNDEKHDGEMIIPVNWQLAGLYNFNGACWFRKEFTINKFNSNDIVRLHFAGVDYFCEVWINGNKIGEHEGYFQSFHFDIEKYLHKSLPNELIVKTASPLEEPGKVWPHKKKLIKGIFNHHDCRPGGWSLERGQEKNTGGIWNDVYIASGSVLIDTITVTPGINWDDNTAAVKVKSFCSSSIKRNVKFTFQLSSPKNEIVNYDREIKLAAGINELTSTITIDDPQLWWCADLGTPYLYNLKIISGNLELADVNFGIRKVFMDDQKQFYINNKKLFLRGVNLILTQFLSDLTSEKINNLIALLKEANVNIVRIHAHVNRNELYEALDEAGILVWQDFALQWTYEESDEFTENAVTQIRDMVRMLYNHPSIAVWCCHNEPGNQIDSLDPVLSKAVQGEDTTRIIRTASNYEEHPYDGWYWGNKEHFAAAPMGPLVTEFGAQALPEKKSLLKFLTKDEMEIPDWNKWEYHNFQYEQTFNVAEIDAGNSVEEFIVYSQKYQAELIKTAVDFYRRKKFNPITGIFQFMFIDCWESISWSVIDYYGIKKQGFYSLKEAFQPLYVSVFLRQRKYFPGSKLQTDVWIINDLHKDFNDCVLRVMLNNQLIGSIEHINTEANEIRFWEYKSIDILLPLDAGISSQKIIFQLVEKNEEKILSESVSEIEFVKKKQYTFEGVSK